MSKARKHALLAAALGGAVIVFAGSNFASSDHEEAKRLREAGDILPLDGIVERARKEHDGRLLESELEREHGRYVYEVEMLDKEGVVWELKYDAKTGELVKSGRDD